MDYIWKIFAAILGYVVFELVDHNRKFQFYESLIKTEVKGLKRENQYLAELYKSSVKEMESLVNHVTIMDQEIRKMDEKFKINSIELEKIRKKIDYMHQEKYHNHHRESRYSGGSVILGGIRSGLNYILHKLADYVLGGISSVLLLT